MEQQRFAGLTMEQHRENQRQAVATHYAMQRFHQLPTEEQEKIQQYVATGVCIITPITLIIVSAAFLGTTDDNKVGYGLMRAVGLLWGAKLLHIALSSLECEPRTRTHHQSSSTLTDVLVPSEIDEDKERNAPSI